MSPNPSPVTQTERKQHQASSELLLHYNINQRNIRGKREENPIEYSLHEEPIGCISSCLELNLICIFWAYQERLGNGNGKLKT